MLTTQPCDTLRWLIYLFTEVGGQVWKRRKGRGQMHEDPSGRVTSGPWPRAKSAPLICQVASHSRAKEATQREDGENIHPNLGRREEKKPLRRSGNLLHLRALTLWGLAASLQLDTLAVILSSERGARQGWRDTGRRDTGQGDTGRRPCCQIEGAQAVQQRPNCAGACLAGAGSTEGLEKGGPLQFPPPSTLPTGTSRGPGQPAA